MADPLTNDLVWAITEVKGRSKALQRRRDYYEGHHRPVVPPVKSTSPLIAELLEDMADNMCDDVVNETADRVSIVSWNAPASANTNPTDGQVRDPRAQRAQDLWDANKGEARERRTYVDMGWAGDAYNIVEQVDDPTAAGGKRTIWHPQDPRQMAVKYSTLAPDTIRVAARVWQDEGGKHWRVNLYYRPGNEPEAGRLLYRFRSRGNGADGGCPEPRAFTEWVPEPTDPEAEVDVGMRDWTRCPVFHFPAGEVGGYGRSYLTPVIPLQDLLNKAIVDLVVAMEDVALPGRWGTGIQDRTDPVTGQPIPYARRPLRASDLMTTPSTEAQFGQFPGADLAQFQETIQGWRVEIARKGYLPAHSVATADGGAPSGLSLLVQEGRQVKRCKAVHRNAGDEWRAQMAYMLTLEGLETQPEDLDIEWAPPGTRDETALWELLTLKRGLGVPDEQLLIEGGYDPEDVHTWLEQRAADQGGRVSAAGPGLASVTIPGMPGGLPVPQGQGAALGLPAAPQPPVGAAQPSA